MPFNPEKEIPGMAVLEDVYDDMCEFSTLYNSYLCARKRKRYRGDVMKFTDDLESHLFEIQEEMKTETYETGPYHRFYVRKPKTRMVMSLLFRDRIVQWDIYNVMNPFYERLFIGDSYACRDGKGTMAAADRLQYWLAQVDRKPGRWYYLKMDINKFFYSVDHEILLDILSRRVKDERLYNLLERIINSSGERFGLPPGRSPDSTPLEEWLGDRGMPIGNLTSQLFANIYLNELDQHCKHDLHLRYYIRYMDDFIVLSEDVELLHRVEADLRVFLKERLNLDTNRKTAIRPCTHGIEFVGYRIYADHRKLRHKTARRVIRTVRSLSVKLSDGVISRWYFDRVCASYKGLLDHCYSRGLKNRLNAIYVERYQNGGHRSRDENGQTANNEALVVAY